MSEQRSSSCPSIRRSINRLLFLGSTRVWYVLLISVLLHAIPCYDILPITGNMSNQMHYRVYLACSIGVMFLAFILFGWVAEIMQRYRVLACGMVAVLLGFMVSGIIIGVLFFYELPQINYQLHDSVTQIAIYYEIPASLALPLIMVGFGMLEANVLRFGTDQLPDSTSKQLSSYIRFYYWSTQIGPFFISSACVTSIFVICKYLDVKYVPVTFYMLLFASFTILTILMILSLLLFCIKKRSLEIQISQGNPFILVFRILKYSWHHKYPENRSAFTYWEEDIPSRFDLGKNKYGGPFTNEEVEGAKSFFHVLFLLCTVFGYQLAGDTFSVSQFIKQYGCPSPSVILLLGLNPQQIGYVIALLVIPLCHVCREHCCHVSMLKKMGIGLLCSLLQEISSTIIGVLAEKNGSNYNVSSISVHGLTVHNRTLSLFGCYTVQTVNVSVMPPVPSVDNFYLWLLLPQVLSGIAQLLVFMTALEFICAQAPYALQGLLIGLWYFTYFINFLIVGNLDTFITESTSWYIYHASKIAAIVVSLLLYCWMAGHYHYRERNEVVNERWMIEQIYDRRLRQREEYENRGLHVSGDQRMYGAIYNTIDS